MHIRALLALDSAMIGKVAVPASAFETYCPGLLELAGHCRGRTLAEVPHDRVLARRLALAVEQGIARLEPHPDEDSRWAWRFGGLISRREHGVVVDNLLRRRLQVCPDDDEIRWLCIVERVYYCDNDFAADLFGRLIVREPMNLRWMVASAIWVNALSGVDTAVALREELLFLNDVRPDIAYHLERLRNADDAHARWVGGFGIAAFEHGTYGTTAYGWGSFPAQE